MKQSEKVTTTTMSHIYAQREELSKDPSLLETVEQARRYFEQMSLPRVQPEVVPGDGTGAAKREFVEAVVKQLGVTEQYKSWMRARSEQSERLIEADNKQGTTLEFDYGGYDPLPLTRSVGEMWWARTDVRFPAGLGGMNGRFDPDGLHLFGSLTYNDGDLWQGSLQTVAQFVLDPSRMPPGGPGRFRSQPFCNLFGTLSAYSGASFGFGDDWSKCWLHTAQFVRGGAGQAIVGEGHNHRNLYFLEQSDRRAVVDFPGSMSFPGVDFNLDPAHNVTTTLEVRLDFQLEGEAGTKFGVREVFRDAILQLFQWNINRL